MRAGAAAAVGGGAGPRAPRAGHVGRGPRGRRAGRRPAVADAGGAHPPLRHALPVLPTQHRTAQQ